MSRKKILVTGCNGQLGLSLRKLSEGFPCYEFTFTDRHNLDITNENALRNSFEAEWFYAVLHFAAYTAVDKAESEKELCRAYCFDCPIIDTLLLLLLYYKRLR